jgi:hypothetical protein
VIGQQEPVPVEVQAEEQPPRPPVMPDLAA